MSEPLNSHGTLVARQPASTPGVFTTIAELGDLDLPELMRNEFSADSQDRNIDEWVIGGILRRSPLVLPLNFIPSNATHDHLTGLYKAIIDKTLDGYRITFPTGTVWIASGQLTSLKPGAPADGKLTLNATIRFKGAMKIDAVTIT